jgi:hypothetical protein
MEFLRRQDFVCAEDQYSAFTPLEIEVETLLIRRPTISSMGLQFKRRLEFLGHRVTLKLRTPTELIHQQLERWPQELWPKNLQKAGQVTMTALFRSELHLFLDKVSRTRF